MSQHDPQGSTLCVHSVCVEQSRRRRGLATAMLKSYVESVALGQPNCAEIRLICKAPLLGLYARCGFSIVGQSDVVHGADPWFEMGLALEETAPRMLPFVQVDAFTSTPFCGNSAAVVFTHNGGNSKWMQTVAMEMNLSETAFVEPAEPTHNCVFSVFFPLSSDSCRPASVRYCCGTERQKPSRRACVLSHIPFSVELMGFRLSGVPFRFAPFAGWSSSQVTRDLQLLHLNSTFSSPSFPVLSTAWPGRGGLNRQWKPPHTVTEASSPPPASVWSLRWFTPVAEVDLCGHATLAAAHALWETGRAAAGRAISFRTLSGELLCRRSPDAPG
ncbi:unnamed protein product [Phaeothamnion confervicola]